jgi:short-subunit dehydrogenase
MSKVIAIFGTGTGLGMSVASRFGREGYKVALVSRDQAKLDGFVSDLAADGNEAAGFQADLIESGSIPGLIDAIRDRLRRIDIIVHNPTATATGFTPAATLTGETLQASLSLFLLSLVEIVRAVSPEMKERRDGIILATHGIAAVRALPNLSGPGTASAAARNYLHCLNAELSGTGVYAGNLVVGGFIARGKKYRSADDAENAKGSTKIPPGMPIPTFEPDDLAEIYWEMANRRDRMEVIPEVARLSTIAGLEIKQIGAGVEAACVSPRRRKRSHPICDPLRCDCRPSST